jgi:hypothetical protein
VVTGTEEGLGSKLEGFSYYPFEIIIKNYIN